MTKIYYTLLAGITVLMDTTTTRAQELKHSDRGDVVQTVILTAAFVALAVLVVGVITNLVNNKIGLIK